MGNEARPIEVFFCSAPKTDQRIRMAIDAWDWWEKQDVQLHFLCPENIDCTLAEFNRKRRIVAENRSCEKFYIVADDDCIPRNDVRLAIESMYRHPMFAILSFWPIEASIERWTPEDYEPKEDSEVMEHVSVGGIRVMRKGVHDKFPESLGKGYDREQADHLRLLGYRVGYFKNFRMSHLGEGKSDLWCG